MSFFLFLAPLESLSLLHVFSLVVSHRERNKKFNCVDILGFVFVQLEININSFRTRNKTNSVRGCLVIKLILRRDFEGK